MAIGVTRAHGGIGIEGEINGNTGAQLGSSLKFFHVMVRNGSFTPQDLRPEMGVAADGQSRDGGLGGAVEKILQVMPSGVVSYNVGDVATGNIYVIVDGVNAPDASVVQTLIQGLVTVPTVAGSTMNVSKTLVTNGTTFTVA